MNLFFINKREYECFIDCMVTYCTYVGAGYKYAFINSVAFDFVEEGSTIAERIKIKGLKCPRIQLTKDKDLKMDLYEGEQIIPCLDGLKRGDMVFAVANTGACPWFPKSIRNRLGHDFILMKEGNDSFYMIDPFFGFVDENATLTMKEISCVCMGIIVPSVVDIPERTTNEVWNDVIKHFTSYAFEGENLLKRAQKIHDAILAIDLDEDVFVKFLIVHEIPIIRKIKLLSDGWYQLAEFLDQFAKDYKLEKVDHLINESKKLGDKWKKEYLFILVQYSDKKHRLTNEKFAGNYKRIFEAEYDFSKKLIEFAKNNLVDEEAV